jgi:DNA repair protein RecO (recombination protein O)
MRTADCGIPNSTFRTPNWQMSRIVKAEGICLHSTLWRETSRLVTLFTREHGKVELRAKGARRPRSKFGAALEVMTRARIIFYKSERHAPYTLSDAEILDDYALARRRAPALRAAAVALEFVNRASEPEVPNPVVFRLLQDLLRALDSGTGDFGAAAFAFMFQAAAHIGYQPQLSHCISCRRPKAAAFSARRGGLLCARCVGLEPDALPVNAELLARLRLLYRGSFERNLQHALPAGGKALVLAFLRFHLERFELKSLRFIGA